ASASDQQSWLLEAQSTSPCVCPRPLPRSCRAPALRLACRLTGHSSRTRPGTKWVRAIHRWYRLRICQEASRLNSGVRRPMMALDRRQFLITAAAGVATLAVPAGASQIGETTMYGLIGKIRALPGQRDALVSILLGGVSEMPG